MKGIILAGGAGTRLFPATRVVSKQLVPVYDKPMIYYPLTVLMLAGIKDILIITTPEDQIDFQRLLDDGSQWGMNFSYEIQPEPKGLAQALIIGEKFLDGDSCTLILGDNIFWGHDFYNSIQNKSQNKGSTVFGYWVNDPERYGVVDFDADKKVISLEEKPEFPKSNYAITGLYCYDGKAPEYAKQVKPSARGELEITSLNNIYLDRGELEVEILGRGIAWLDTGTHEALNEASTFVRTVQERQGLLVASPEEVAYRMGFIDTVRVMELAEKASKSEYGKRLIRMLGVGL